MSNDDLPGTWKLCPALYGSQLSLPANFTRHTPSTSSITSGSPVLKCSDEGRITPTLFFVPSASSMLCETQWPSKYTLARVLMCAWILWVMAFQWQREVAVESRDVDPMV